LIFIFSLSARSVALFASLSPWQIHINFPPVQRFEVRDNIEQFLVDAALAQTMDETRIVTMRNSTSNRIPTTLPRTATTAPKSEGLALFFMFVLADPPLVHTRLLLRRFAADTSGR
jgi:hypothetical protein